MSKKTSVNIVHLYSKEMNIYGDNGNVVVVAKRLEWRGYKTQVTKVGLGDELPKNADIVIAGGGQDIGQREIVPDLRRKGAVLRSMSKDGVVFLTVCGLYQLFGRSYTDGEGRLLRGINVFDAYTEASQERLIGNVVLDTSFGRVAGFENHSGQTYLGAGQAYLGRVRKGGGNNTNAKKEGAIIGNTFGTYLHGPILPKNPQFADELIRRALERKFGNCELDDIDDSLAQQAADIAAKRPR